MLDQKEYILSKFPNATMNSSGKIHTKCPFHDDIRPSFSMDVNKGVFICGSAKCGVRGNFPLFYKLMEGLTSWKDVFAALKVTSTDYNIDELFNKSSEVKKGLTINPFPEGEFLEEIGIIAYLEQRGISRQAISDFGLKYGKKGQFSEVSIEDSVVCPVWDIDGSYKTFQVRYVGGSKYRKRWMNPSNSPIQYLLYGGWTVSKMKRFLWVVEGASDCWRIYSLGSQAVGLNTKVASAAQMNRIFTVCRLYDLIPIACMDGDAVEATEKIYHELLALGLPAKKVILPLDSDPGSLSQEDFQTIMEGLSG
jgi:DNA primase